MSLVTSFSDVCLFVLPPRPPPNELWAYGFRLPQAQPITIRLPSTPSAEWALGLGVLWQFVSIRDFSPFGAFTFCCWSLAIVIVVVMARPLGSRGLPMPLRAWVRAHR